MKKIAFFVEGQTEQFFINKLLIEIAGVKNILIRLKKFKGRGKPTENIIPKTLSQATQEVKHTVLVYDCGGDGGVKTRILEEYQDLLAVGYSEIIGLRDLYPLTDLLKLENRLVNGLVLRGIRQELSLPTNTSIIVAVREIEDWFLAECNHYSCIDKRFDHTLLATSVGFDPCSEDLTLRSSSAADDLSTIYQIFGKNYNKKKYKIEKTVECLDYANLYLNIKNKIVKLNDLISKIDKKTQ